MILFLSVTTLNCATGPLKKNDDEIEQKVEIQLKIINFDMSPDFNSPNIATPASIPKRIDSTHRIIKPISLTFNDRLGQQDSFFVNRSAFVSASSITDNF